MPSLIIHADDFGLTPGVTRGIVEAHAAGVVGSTSVMVGLPGWHDAVPRLRDSSLDVGLHFNLLVGRPLTHARTLCDRDTGLFFSLAALATRAMTARIDPADVAAECAAQLDTLRAEGARVSHLDSHRHTHVLPVVWNAVRRVARERAVPFVRWPVDTARLTGKSAPFLLLGVSRLWRRPHSGVDHFTGLTLDGAGDFAAGLRRAIDTAKPGVTELMVHPGYTEPALGAIDTYTWQRERELAALLAPALHERLAQGDVTLTHFGALAGAAGIFPA